MSLHESHPYHCKLDPDGNEVWFPEGPFSRGYIVTDKARKAITNTQRPAVIGPAMLVSFLLLNGVIIWGIVTTPTRAESMIAMGLLCSIMVVVARVLFAPARKVIVRGPRSSMRYPIKESLWSHARKSRFGILVMSVLLFFISLMTFVLPVALFSMGEWWTASVALAGCLAFLMVPVGLVVVLRKTGKSELD